MAQPSRQLGLAAGLGLKHLLVEACMGLVEGASTSHLTSLVHQRALHSAGASSSTFGTGPSLLRQLARSRIRRLGTSTAAAEASSTSTSSTANVGAALSRGSSRSSTKIGRLLQDYKQLSKLKLSLLVVMTASAGFAAGSGERIDWEQLAWTSLGTLGAAACANTLNQIYEMFNDARMTRTANRPLAAGRMSRVHAAFFALACGTAGLGLLWEKTNPVTTALGAGNVLLYAAVYTPLKQLSIYNTWVGAVVGAIPPLMGWAAATGGELQPGAALLAAALFSWQMPHFLSLAWMCKEDYARGGFRMLPHVDASGRRTALVALRHAALLAPLGAAAAVLGVASWPFAYEAAALAGVLAAGAVRFAAAPGPAVARRLFKSSLVYLPLLLLALGVHRQPNRGDLSWEEAGERLVAALPQWLKGAAWAGMEALGTVHGQLTEALIGPSARCPSKAYGDSGDDQQQEQQEGSGDDDVLAAEAVNAADFCSASPQQTQQQEQQQQQHSSAASLDGRPPQQ